MKEKKEKEKIQNKDKNLDMIKVKRKESSNEMIKKVVSRMSYLIIMLAIIIMAYVGINLLMKKLNPTDIDLTADKIYSLSDTSKQIAKSIDQDVKILLINMNNAQSVIDFSNRYHKENDKIKVEEINDINKSPELTKKYNLTTDNMEIIIECGERSKVLTTEDLYTYDYTTYEQKDLTEEAMTNALLDVTTEKKPKVYFITGNNKNLDIYMNAFKKNLSSQANEVEDLDLLVTGKVPDDCNVLVLTTLSKDFKDIEKDAILKYIKKGGKIALFTDANMTKTKMPNFQKILDEYGVSISEGILLEQDKSKMLSNSPSAILVTVESGTSVTKNINMETNACFINSGKIILKDTEALEKLGVQAEILASTSSEAFYRSDLQIESASKQKGEEQGVATVGALLTKKIDDDTSSKLIVYSNNMFVTSMQIQLNIQYYTYAYELYNNQDLALNSIAYLTDRDDIIMLRKDTETTTYTVTEQQQTIILTIIFLVPVIIMIGGIIVWIIRRRKK